MKTPTWAIVVGILLLLGGGCSLTKNAQSIYTPQMLEMQQKMMNKMADSSPRFENDSLPTHSISEESKANNEVFKNMTESMQEMFFMSEFTKKWTVRLGIIGLIVASIYILSGVFLLIKKPFSIQLVYFALLLSVLFSITQSVILTSDAASGFMAKSSALSNIFGIVFDIILLIIIVLMDKSAYKGIQTTA